MATGGRQAVDGHAVEGRPGGRRIALGRLGEDLAAEHLRACGLAILERNWRCAAGELDIVARESGTLVVCEVKTRTSVAFGHPLAAVTAVKLRRMRRLAAEWLSVRGIRAASVRFDVVGVLLPAGGTPTIEHLRGVEQ